ncbi:hypothetical protein TNCV_167591 [Trichonephila clavipes]|nr:hypothetical protein TNCV_167591 [Trichonephila clavipes]
MVKITATVLYLLIFLLEGYSHSFSDSNENFFFRFAFAKWSLSRTRGRRSFRLVVVSSPDVTKDPWCKGEVHFESVEVQNPRFGMVWKFEEPGANPSGVRVNECILTSPCSATRAFGDGPRNLNNGQVPSATPELTPLSSTTPTGGHLSSRQI